MCGSIYWGTWTPKVHVWLVVNPDEIQETPMPDQKVGVWYVASWSKVIGPTFFENIINSEHYDILYPFIAQLTEDKIAHAHFQQDSATAHMAHVLLAFLHDVFNDWLMSRDI